MSSKLYSIGALAAAAVVGYCVYFDYSRRNSPEFRRKLKKSVKKYKKQQVAKEESDKKAKFLSIKNKLTEALESDPLPTDLEAKQTYFLQNVGLGEQFSASPDTQEESAICFYKAVAVHPQPAQLLSVLQTTLPERIYELFVFLIAVQPPTSLTSILGEDLNGVDANIQVVNPEADVQ